MPLHRWRGHQVPVCVDQAASIDDDLIDLSPVSDAPLEDLRDKWAPLVHGLEPPLFYERYEPEEIEPCRTP